MYETCIFDLYGTLVDIHTDEEQEEVWERLALFYGYYGAFYSAEELRERFRETVSGMERADVRRRADAHEAFPEIQIEKVFLKLFLDKGAEADRTLAVHAGQFFRVLSTEYIRLYEGAGELLELLKSHGKKLYLLSNAQKIFTEYELRALDIFRFFDGIFISSDYGCKKPDRAFFEKLLVSGGIQRENAVMIGNDGICDVEGAHRAGLPALYIHSNLSPEGEMPRAEHTLGAPDMKRVGEILLGR